MHSLTGRAGDLNIYCSDFKFGLTLHSSESRIVRLSNGGVASANPYLTGGHVTQSEFFALFAGRSRGAPKTVPKLNRARKYLTNDFGFRVAYLDLARAAPACRGDDAPQRM